MLMLQENVTRLNVVEKISEINWKYNNSEVFIEKFSGSKYRSIKSRN